MSIDSAYVAKRAAEGRGSEVTSVKTRYGSLEIFKNNLSDIFGVDCPITVVAGSIPLSKQNGVATDLRESGYPRQCVFLS